jgi:hypothetical protein
MLSVIITSQAKPSQAKPSQAKPSQVGMATPVMVGTGWELLAFDFFRRIEMRCLWFE